MYTFKSHKCDACSIKLTGFQWWWIFAFESWVRDQINACRKLQSDFIQDNTDPDSGKTYDSGETFDSDETYDPEIEVQTDTTPLTLYQLSS